MRIHQFPVDKRKMGTIYMSKWVYERKRVNVSTMVKANKKEYDRECTRSE